MFQCQKFQKIIVLFQFHIFSAVKQSFVDSLKVELAVSNKAAKIYFNSNSDTIYRLYTAPFYISKSESFNAYSYFGNDSSKTVLASYFKTEGGRSLDLKINL